MQAFLHIEIIAKGKDDASKNFVRSSCEVKLLITSLAVANAKNKTSD